MAIQRWDPVRDVVQLQKGVNRMFEDVLSRSATPGGESISSTAWKPPMDLFEDQGRYILRADLPGVEPSDVELQVEDGQLVLRGERKGDTGVATESFLRVERPRGRFAVQVSLPPSVDPKRIKAHHQNGVLEIVLPKIQREEGHLRIEVGTG